MGVRRFRHCLSFCIALSDAFAGKPRSYKGSAGL